MARQVKRILSISTLFFLIGLFVAYYNTSSFGYDNANIISFNNEGIYIFDMDIKYKKVQLILDKIEEKIPKEHIAI